MPALLFAALIAAQGGPGPLPQPGGTDPAAAKLSADIGRRVEGDWTVVAIERFGRPAQGAGAAATMRAGVLTNVDGGVGGPTVRRFEFLPEGAVRMTVANQKPFAGVYVLSADYFAVSISEDADNRTGAATPAGKPAVLTLVLKRAGKP